MAMTLMAFSSIVLILAAAAFSPTQSEIFTALTHMAGFVRLEQILSPTLEEYLKYESAASADVKRFVNDVKRHVHDVTEEEMEHFVGHPVNSYLLLRRFVKGWRDILSKVDERSPQGKELVELIKEKNSSFPTLQDFQGCASAILRIQNVYRISAAKIASGSLSDKMLSPQLNAVHCLELGHINHNLEKHEEAYGWFLEAWKRISPFDLDSGLTKKNVLEYLIWAEYKTARFQDALNHTTELLKEDPKNKDALQGKIYYQYKLKQMEDGEDFVDEENHKEKKTSGTQSQQEFTLHYERLCRGNTNKSQTELDKLSCYYFNKNPLLILKPVKIEMSSLKPDIYLLHDIIEDEDIETIKKIASPRLSRATVSNMHTGHLEFADYRISKSAWLEDYEDDSVYRLSLRLEAITGLSTSGLHSEALQVVNYGIGGQYEPHLDHALSMKSAIFSMGMRNRIATVLIYMSDVEAGGSTVFLDAETKVEARKGTAAFWFNLRKSGQSDGTTRHAACPVIVGSKWVANKWIHEDGQEFRRRCGLSPDE